VMKPNPLASLNHFTFPVVRISVLPLQLVGSAVLRYLSDYCLFAIHLIAFLRQKIKETWQHPRSLNGNLASSRNHCDSG